MRLLAIKRYADWVSKPKFVFVDVKGRMVTNKAIKQLLDKLHMEGMRNVGEFIVVQIYKDWFVLKRFYKIPDNPTDFYQKYQKVSYLRFDELKIINWAFENYLIWVIENAKNLV